VTDRQPPHSQDAEQAALGAMLLVGNEAIGPVLEILHGESDFYGSAHRKIYAAIIQLYKKTTPADITTVSSELERTGDLADCGGRAYLAGLASGVATAANAEYYANIIMEKAQLRRAIEQMSDIVNQCYRQEKEPSEILDEAEQRIFEITARRDRQTFRSIYDMIPDLVQEISVRQEAGGGLVGETTGYKDLDRMLGGLAGGNLYLLAGRPSMGKSAYAVNISERTAKASGKVVPFFSLEMTGQNLALRAFAGHAGMNPKMVGQGRLNDDDWRRLMDTAGYWEDVRVLIDPTAFITPMGIRSKLRQLASKYELGLVVVDYLQLMDADSRHENRNQTVTDISRRLKAISKEFDVPVLALSQLSRAVEIRGGTRKPQLSDLRESGALEQDADVVMFIHREEYYLRDAQPDDPKLIEAKGKAEVIIAKQRNGSTGSVWLRWDDERVRFEDLEMRRGPIERDIAF